MAPSSSHPSSSASQSASASVVGVVSAVPLWRRLYLTLSSRRYDVPYMILIVTFECLLCMFIVRRVAYTEIDWIAYVEQVETYQAGERDYVKIRGPTGPLVYPAGFLYVYSLIKWLAELGLRDDYDGDDGAIIDYDGRRIRNAQYVFVVLYVCNAAVVSTLYTIVARAKADRILARGATASSKKTDGDTKDTDEGKAALRAANVIWSWRFAMALLCLSKRLHSIFVLRLFNDGVAMLLFYISALLFVRSKWRIGCVFYSLAVGVKMNVLLFAPGLLLLLLQGHRTLRGTIECLSICAAVQLALGWPFLSRHPVNYVRKAFEFDRVFMYKWTVNWKFLSEEVFVSKKLSVLLLALHLSVLAVLAAKWLRATGRQRGGGPALFLVEDDGGSPNFESSSSSRPASLRGARGGSGRQREVRPSETTAGRTPQRRRRRHLSTEYVLYTLFAANLVGICFARTLHYQFYSWYYHTLPFLLWSSSGALPLPARLAVWAAMEYAFNVYPATSLSSTVLQVAHFVALVTMMVSPIPRVLVAADDDNGGGGYPGGEGGKPTMFQL